LYVSSADEVENIFQVILSHCFSASIITIYFAFYMPRK